MKNSIQNIKAIRLQFGDLTITAEVEARLEELGFTPETLIDAIGEHKSGCEGNPSIYCGTYGKYSGEKDPELMFQDYEAFPREWYSEGFMSEEDFEHIREYNDMCDKHGQDAVDDYMEFRDNLDDFEEAYCGHWDSEEAFGRDLFMYDYSVGANNNVFRVV